MPDGTWWVFSPVSLVWLEFSPEDYFMEGLAGLFNWEFIGDL